MTMSEEYIGITTLLKELDQAFHADLICKQDVINLIINLPTTRVVDVKVPKCRIQCPFGGDETNDCADCAYSGDFHFVKGECIRRDFNDNPEFLEGGKEE